MAVFLSCQRGRGVWSLQKLIAVFVILSCWTGSCVSAENSSDYANQIFSQDDEHIGFSPAQRGLRSSRLFPLFTIIRFTNEVCRTTSEEGGVCYTRKQCNLLRGTAQGTCAQGLGVCCQFVANCSSMVTQNGTLFRNQNYPSAYQVPGGGSTDICQLRIRKPANSCQVRLNFLKFDIDGPVPPSTGTTTVQDVGACKTDQLTIVSSGATVPQLCGSLSGQHMYLDFGSSDTITLSLLLNGNVQRDRTWNIEIVYIPCNSLSRAPSGCLQYFTGVSGTVESFNTIQGAGTHLANQDYSVCVRMEDGMRSIEWTGCTGSSVKISGPAPPTGAQTGVTKPTVPAMLADYLIIPGGIQNPFPTTGAGAGQALPISDTDRFFDAYFFSSGAGVRSTVRPFIMHFKTDGTELATGDASAGFCLKWQQSPNT